MRVVLTGATGHIGTPLTRALLERGDDVAVLSRNAESARSRLGDCEVFQWDPEREPAPEPALTGRDAVVNLAGERLDQRWTNRAKEEIRSSRIIGTRNLVEGIRGCEEPPGALVSASAIGYYGARGSEKIDEESLPGDGFLVDICKDWETEALRANGLGLRVVTVRTGITLDREGGVLKRLAPIFRFGIGGPVGRGKHYMSWIHLDDLVGTYLFALTNEELAGAVNATAPNPVTNREFSKTLGEVLHRPAVLPVPPPALKLLYGEMSSIVTTGQRVIPKRLGECGFEFKHPKLVESLRSELEDASN